MKHLSNRALSFALCVLLTLSLFACGEKNGGAQSEPPAAQTEEPAAQTEEPAAQTETQEQAETQTEASAEQPDDPSEIIQFQLGASHYAVDVPRSYRNGEVTMDELKSNQIAYYYSPTSDMDFDVYEFLKPDPEMSLRDFVRANAEDFNGSDLHFWRKNGITAGSYKSREVYDGVEYDVLVVLMEDGEEYVEIVFWLDGETAEQQAMDILSTLSYVETFDLQLGDSPFYLTIPVGYVPGEVTEEQAADDMIGYYYNESSPLDFDVYQFGKDGYTLEKYAIEEANRYEAEGVDYRTVNGIDLAFYYSYEESEGEMYTVANYLFEYGDEFLEIAFWLDGEIAVKQTDHILSTLKRVDA